MPPEQPPWERKEYPFKDQRKYDRLEALGGYGGGSSSAPRWRDPYHAPRDLPRGSPRRPLSGQYRQGGGYHQFYPEDSVGHGGTPSRSDRFWTEGDGFRSSSFRYSSGSRSNNGGCSRENRGSFRRSIYWDYGDFSRQHHQEPHANPSQRAVTAPISSTSQFPPKDKDETIGGIDDGFGAGHKLDHRDHSLGVVPWKKWSRPASTKTGRSELEESGLEVGLPVMKETPILSPVICPLPPNEGTPKNKPRLGWGQGLAKYEKQKVEGSTEHSTGGGSVVLSDNSQKAMGTSGCLSPSTPCSITCSSSPGTEDKPCSRIIHNDFGVSQNNGIPGVTSPPMYMEVSINFDGWEVNPASLDAWLVELLQSEDSFSGDSLMRHSVMSKLLRLKGDVANGLERIENKIDLLEKELKLLHSDAKDGACQGSLESVDNSTIQLNEQPSNGLPSVSTALKDQMMTNMEVTSINERASSISLVENVTIEDNSIVHSETVSCEISASSALAKKCSGSCTEEFPLYASSLEDDRLWATEKNVDSHSMGRLMIASGDEVGIHVDGDSGSVDRHYDGTTQGKTDSNLITLFVDSNNITEKHVSELYGTTTLSTNVPESNIWGKIDFTLCRKNDMKIKEKLATNKRQLKFKEQVLALKFRALHHLWKEDLRLLSTRKHRTNSSKRCESNSLLLNGPQKQRSSIRSRFTLHAGNLTLVPTTEIMSFTSKLLSDSQIKLCRNSLKMPALLLEERERWYSRFVTHNGLIEDPPSFEMERTTINPWSHHEKEVFMEMLARYGKDFTMISSFLDHKTTADCIEFYYKKHKSESFKEVKKWLDLRKQQQCPPANTYLVGSGKNRKYEISTALDVFDAANVVEAHGHGAARIEKYTGSTTYCTANAVKVGNVSPAYLEGANDVTLSGQERESVAAEVLAGIRGALSSEAMNSSVTSSIDHAEKVKCATKGQLMTRNLEEEDACSNEDCGELDSTDWTDEEKSKFIHALSIHGKDFSSVSNYIRTRSREQCKIFFSKARKCLALDAINPGCVSEVMPVSITNGGRSHTDDASGGEMDSATCSTQSCSKMDVDVSQSLANTNYEENAHAPSIHDFAEMVRSNEYIDSEFVRANLVDGEEKIDEKQASITHDEMPRSKEVNLQSNIRTMEGVAAASECIEAEQLCGTVDAAERETGVRSIIYQAESNVISRNIEPLRECLEVESEELTCRMILNTSMDGNFPMNSIKKEVKSNLPELTEVGLSNKRLLNINSIENNNSLCSSALDFNGSEAPLISGEKVNGFQRLNFNPNYQQQMQRDLLSCPQKKPMLVSSKQENDCCVTSNSILSDPCNMCSVGSSNILLETNLNFEKPESKSHLNVLGKRELCQQYMLRNVPVNQVDLNIQILRGYKLSALKQDFKREVDPPSGVCPSLLETELKKNGVSLPNHLFASDARWNQSTASNLPDSASGIVDQVKRENKSEVELTTCFENASSEIKEQHTGDVKLFGKILSHTSSQKSSSSSHGNNLRLASPKLDGTPTLNCASNAKNSDQVVSDAGVGQACLEDLPVTYGFWDGKRVQTGFSSLPETAAVLAKYQGSMTTPFFSDKDGPGCSGILTDYQKPCTDTKLVGDISQLPKRNGIEIIPGFQQQRRATPLGVNIVGRGIFAGGGVVSDPVAALKMHYAARTNVLGNDMEPWRGDVGGR